MLPMLSENLWPTALVLLGCIVLGTVVYLVVRHFVLKGWNACVNAVQRQLTRRRRREQLKKLPEFMQNAHRQFDQAGRNTTLLTLQLQRRLNPLNNKIQAILSITENELSYAEKVRSFYNVSLPAYTKFVAKLQTDHKQLDKAERAKVNQSLLVFKEDFKEYYDSVQQARRFDFDVMMDVIEVRLKNR